MVDTAGLRLDQAPPIHLPLRLLLTAPWFLLAAAVLLMVQGEQVFVSRWTPAALALTHLIGIGFLGQVMCGSLLQMLPVIAGAPVPRVHLVASLVHLGLSAGAGLMAAGYLGAGASFLAWGAAAAAVGFTVFLIGAGAALIRAQGAPQTRNALRLAIASLLPTLFIGVTLILTLVGWLYLPRFPSWVDLHLNWGLFGWIGLLILGVAYQVVPMFHVTPGYPALMTRILAPMIFTALLAVSLGALFEQPWMTKLGHWILSFGFSAFALMTLYLQRRRARPRLDGTLLHWWSAMASILAAVAAWWAQAPAELVGVLILMGVGIGLPSGMLFKIVPFLCWFHLQNRQVSTGAFAVRIPHMQKLLPEHLTRAQWGLHLAALLVLACAYLEPRLAPMGALLLGLGATLLGVLLLAVAWRYHGTLRLLMRSRTL